MKALKTDGLGEKGIKYVDGVELQMYGNKWLAGKAGQIWFIVRKM